MTDSSQKRTAQRMGAIPDKDGGQTKPSRDGKAAPKLPHERDESSQDQQTREVSTARVGKQAFNDMDSGQVDTDKGPVAERLYEGLKKKP